VSVIPRPTSLGRRAPGPMVSPALRTPRAPGETPANAPALADCRLEFGVSVGGLSRSELAGELDARPARLRDPATIAISMRVLVRRDGGPDPESSRHPVRATVEITLEGTPLGEASNSFAVVGELRGMLTTCGRHRHLDLADDAGPWLRCSVSGTLDDLDGASAGPRDIDSSYAWLRPIADWRIFGGTASPRTVRWVDETPPAILGSHDDDGSHHAAAGS